MEIITSQIVGIVGTEMYNPQREINFQNQREILLKYCLGNKELIGLTLKYLSRKGLSNVSQFDLMVVVASLNPLNSIGAMNESYYDEAKKALVKIAYIYCSIPRESMVGVGFDEIATVLKRSYSNLTLEELTLAFELAALKKTDATLISYGAGFTVSMVGDVLEAYKKWKMSIKWNMVEFGEVLKKEIGVESDNKKNTQKVNEWWFNLISKVRAGASLPEWQYLPIDLLLELNDSKILDFEGNEEVKKDCYVKGINQYIDDLRAKKRSGAVVGYNEKLDMEKELEAIRKWREDDLSSLKKDVIPEKLRVNGWIYGLKMYAVEYIKKMVNGEIV